MQNIANYQFLPHHKTVKRRGQSSVDLGMPKCFLKHSLIKNWALSCKRLWTWLRQSFLDITCGLLRKEYPDSIWPLASLYSCAYPCCEVKPLGSGGRAWTGWPVIPTTQEKPASTASIFHVPNHQVPFQEKPPLWNCRAAKIIIAVFPTLKEEPCMRLGDGSVKWSQRLWCSVFLTLVMYIHP